MVGIRRVIASTSLAPASSSACASHGIPAPAPAVELTQLHQGRHHVRMATWMPAALSLRRGDAPAFERRTPLGSLLPPRVDPDTGDSDYSPFTGHRLVVKP